MTQLPQAHAEKTTAPWRRWLGFKSQTVRTDSFCAKCGYLVTGLPTFVCPECGSDLRVVGINTRQIAVGRKRPRWRELPKKVRWQFRWILLADLLGLMIVQGLLVMSWPGSVTTRNTDIWRPKSQAPGALRISTQFTSLDWMGSTYDQRPKTLSVGIEIVDKSGVTHSINVDLPRLLASYPSRFITGGGTLQTVLDRDELLKWEHDEAQLDTTDPQVRAQANAILALLKHYNTQPPPAWSEFRDRENSELEAAYIFAGFTGGASYRSGPPLFVFYSSFPVYLVIAMWAMCRAYSRGTAMLIEQNLWQPPRKEAAPVASRTLTILFVDMKDFTARAAASSRADLVDLLRAHRTIVDRALAGHAGRLIKTVGDGMIASFESATNAVLAGSAIQEAVKHAPTEGAPAMELRVAICTGEVTLERDDVYGPTVNIAARVQAIAAVGEVYVTEATRLAISESETKVELVGQFELKGVAAQVTVYRALATDLAAPLSPARADS